MSFAYRLRVKQLTNLVVFMNTEEYERDGPLSLELRTWCNRFSQALLPLILNIAPLSIPSPILTIVSSVERLEFATRYIECLLIALLHVRPWYPISGHEPAKIERAFQGFVNLSTLPQVIEYIKCFLQESQLG
jgi:hypothetical protein